MVARGRIAAWRAERRHPKQAKAHRWAEEHAQAAAAIPPERCIDTGRVGRGERLRIG